MGKPLDYNVFAKTYAETRSTVPWIVNPLLREIKKLKRPSSILEIGCGTGNYIIEICERLPCNIYKGFDLSEEMLKAAKSRTDKIEFKQGDADSEFPYSADSCEVAFAVDVIHHIVNYNVFFKECRRVLRPKGVLIIVTDSEDNIKRRSGIKYFPEKLDVELDRYPKIEELNSFAKNSGFDLISSELVESYSDIDDEMVSKIGRKHSSSSRLISEEAFQRGLERVRQAKLNGEKWFSNYTFLIYKRNN
jgi:ubiquinone/menaquinone biosynthesis C-methylase UbiE